jgi:hypothetical protein
LYGDQFRSPGRDDRQDGTDPQRASWEAHVSLPSDDVKVAGAPSSVPPGGSYGGQDTGGYGPDPLETTSRDAGSDSAGEGSFGSYDTGSYDTGSYGTGSYDTGPYGTGSYDTSSYGTGPYETGAYDAGSFGTGEYGTGTPTPGEHDAGATAAYDMGEQEPVPGFDASGPYEEPDATSAMPPPYADAGLAQGPDFEGMRRSPHATNRRLVKFAAVAAAVAVVGGGGVAWAMSGGSGDKAPTGQQAQAQVPPPAPLTDAQRKDAADKRRKQLKKVASRAARDQVNRPKLLARGTPPPTKKPGVATAGNPVPAGEAQRIAKSLMPSYGWSPSSQFGCLVDLWNRESHWNVHARNPSGAAGIPQALPGEKMASAGPDWQNNATTQIKWGFGYIKSRYGTPCAAWAHSQSTGWY